MRGPEGGPGPTLAPAGRPAGSPAWPLWRGAERSPLVMSDLRARAEEALARSRYVRSSFSLGASMMHSYAHLIAAAAWKVRATGRGQPAGARGLLAAHTWAMLRRWTARERRRCCTACAAAPRRRHPATPTLAPVPTLARAAAPSSACSAWAGARCAERRLCRQTAVTGCASSVDALICPVAWVADWLDLQQELGT